MIYFLGEMVYEVGRKHLSSPATGDALSNADAQPFLTPTHNPIFFWVTFPSLSLVLSFVPCCPVFFLTAD